MNNIIGLETRDMFPEMSEYKRSLNWYKTREDADSFKLAKEKETKIFSTLISAYVSGRVL